jgi:putative transposase
VEAASSVHIKRLFRGILASYARDVDLSEPVWQARYDDFNLFSAKKVEEKLVYMHQDPVRAGLAAHACDWPWSSARYDEQGRTVGVAVGWTEPSCGCAAGTTSCPGHPRVLRQPAISVLASVIS